MKKKGLSRTATCPARGALSNQLHVVKTIIIILLLFSSTCTAARVYHETSKQHRRAVITHTIIYYIILLFIHTALQQYTEIRSSCPQGAAALRTGKRAYYNDIIFTCTDERCCCCWLQYNNNAVPRGGRGLRSRVRYDLIYTWFLPNGRRRRGDNNIIIVYLCIMVVGARVSANALVM